jgi:hypothetical protein
MATVSDIRTKQVRALCYEVVKRSFAPSSERKLLFSHFGDFNASKTEHLIKVVESLALEEGAKRRIMRRLCSVMIESIQNIAMHGARDQDGRLQSFIAITKEDDAFQLTTGNLLLAEDVGLLEYKLDELNKLERPALRKEYIETLSNENFSYKGGAGLGFLTIAKKSHNPLSYKLSQLDETLAYFILEVKIDDESVAHG